MPKPDRSFSARDREDEQNLPHGVSIGDTLTPEVLRLILKKERDREAARIYDIPKSNYQIREGRLIRADTKEDLHDHEPVFIMRARDSMALAFLRIYREMHVREEVRFGLERAIVDFENWMSQHPQLVKNAGGASQVKFSKDGIVSGTFSIKDFDRLLDAFEEAIRYVVGNGSTGHHTIHKVRLALTNAARMGVNEDADEMVPEDKLRKALIESLVHGTTPNPSKDTVMLDTSCFDGSSEVNIDILKGDVRWVGQLKPQRSGRRKGSLG